MSLLLSISGKGLRTKLSIPAPKFLNFGKASYWKHWKVSENKSIEIQYESNMGDLLGFSFDVTQREDHAGIDVTVEIFKQFFNFHFYDHRHWNYEENRWQTLADIKERGDSKQMTIEMANELIANYANEIIADSSKIKSILKKLDNHDLELKLVGELASKQYATLAAMVSEQAFAFRTKYAWWLIKEFNVRGKVKKGNKG